MVTESTRIAVPRTKNMPPRRIPVGRKLLYSVLVLIVAVAVCEATLYLCGVQPAYATRDFFVGFEPGERLFVRQGDFFVTNELKLSFFNDSKFTAEKQRNTIRIFSLGGSTTYGHPYNNKASYNAWLQANLDLANPEHSWEVINCGGISYASYRLANLTEELVRYEPDVLVVYTGHNEFLEHRTYQNLRERPYLLTKSLQAASRLRCFALIHDLLDADDVTLDDGLLGNASTLAPEVDTILEHAGPTAYERNDELSTQIVEHFRDSITRIVALARNAKAQVIFIRPACNLRDFSPFHSQHSGLGSADEQFYSRKLNRGLQAMEANETDLALEYFAEAEQIDARYAAGLYGHAEAWLAAGRFDKAREYFVRAKDEDVCPLRALTAIDQAIQEVAKEQDVSLIDFPTMLGEQCTAEFGHDILGSESFVDHVHPTPDAHRTLGLAIYKEVVDALGVPHRTLTAKQEHELDTQVYGLLSPYDQAMSQHALAMTLSWAGKTQEALPIIELAAQALPNDSEIAYEHGHILDKLGRSDEAIRRFHDALQFNPKNSLARARLGMASYAAKDYEQAADHFRRAIQDTPDRAPIHVRISMRVSLASCLYHLDDDAGAKALINEALEIDPHSQMAQRTLRELFP